MVSLNKKVLDEDTSQDQWIFFVGLLILVSLALFLATTLRYNDSLSIDEPFTAYRVNLPLQQMLTLLWGDNQQPLYYVMLRPWRLLFGESEIALRSLSTIFFCGTVVVTSFSARTLYGSLAGLVAGALVAFSSIGLLYAATARPYMLATFFVALYCWVALYWIPGSSKQNDLLKKRDAVFILLLGLIGALGLLSHSIFIFTLAAFFISALVLSWRHAFRFGLAALAALLFFLLIWGPSFIQALSLHSQNSYYGIPGIAELLKGYGNIVGRKKSLVLLAILAFLFVTQRQAVIKFFTTRWNLFVSLIVILSVMLPVIVSQVNQVYLAARTPVIALPPLALVVAGLVILIERRWVLAATILALAATSIYYSLTQWVFPVEPQFKHQMAQVVQESECGDTIVSVGFTEGEVSYYLRTLQAPDCLVHETFPAGKEILPWEMIYIDHSADDRPQLEAEAQTLINKVARQGVNQLWILAPTRSRNAILTDILKEQTNQLFRLVEESEGCGTFNDVLLRYENLD